ncbi:MAG: hypothetical protein E3J72_08560 [Planctomycetota bacterium]|nr:MAG: hypothetical protein E3J72_08560 [Planctomycetota bacterium]
MSASLRYSALFSACPAAEAAASQAAPAQAAAPAPVPGAPVRAPDPAGAADLPGTRSAIL